MYQETKQGLCNNLEWWGGKGDGESFKMEGTYVYLRLILIDVWQKTKFYKAINLQLKIQIN